jgi:hypothetical protein
VSRAFRVAVDPTGSDRDHQLARDGMAGARSPLEDIPVHAAQHHPMLRAVVVPGSIATAALTAGAQAGNAAGLTRLDFPGMLGSAVTGRQDLARPLGWALHAFNGLALAAGYTALFRHAEIAPSGARGALIGLAHGVFSVGFMALAPAVHPRPEMAGLRRFGARAYGPGWIPAMLLGHVLYGAIVGVTSRHPRDEALSGSVGPGRVRRDPAYT